MRKTLSLIACLLLCLGTTPVQGQALHRAADPIAQAQAELAQRPHAGEEVWRRLSAGGLPIIRPDPGQAGHVRASFVFRAGPEVESVRLDSVLNAVEVDGFIEDYVDDFTLPLTRLPGTSIWWRTMSVPADSQAVYSFLAQRADGVRRYSDSANPRRLRGAESESVFVADTSTIDPALRPVALRNRLEPIARVIDSQALSRPVFAQMVSLPEAMPDAPVLVLYDAFLWGVRAPAWEIVQNLVAEGRIPPLHVVLIDELDPQSANQAYSDQAQFLTEELPAALLSEGLRGPFILAGASRRGLAATVAGLHANDGVMAVISLSGSFYWAPDGEPKEWLSRTLPQGEPGRPRFFLAAGSLETMHTAQNEGAVMLTANRNMYQALLRQGYEADLHIYSGGHDVAGWRGALAAMLVRVFDSP